MRILRLETDTGRGVFHQYSAIEYYSNAMGGNFKRPYEHPEPEEDGIPEPYYHLICGFRNWNQLKVWFPDEAAHPILTEHNVWLSVYEIAPEHILFGGVQLMFKRDEASLVAKMPVTDFPTSPLYF